MRSSFAPDGTALGQILQAGDTYHSAPWHDPRAGHGANAPAYLLPSSQAGDVVYAGQHREPDIFAGVGGGAVIRQGNAAHGGYFKALNLGVPVVPGDIVRAHAIVSVLRDGAKPGSVQLRLLGDSAGAASFAFDGEGRIGAPAINRRSMRGGSFDMGQINGRRWTYLWFDTVAAKGGTSFPAIGFGEAAPGRGLHICELMVQANPASAPAAVPVCASDARFEPDTIHAPFGGGTGCIMTGIAAARASLRDGTISPPAIPVGLPYLPVENDIRLVRANEPVDRTGILFNENAALYLEPWGKPDAHVASLGPGAYPEPIRLDQAASGCGNYTLQPVFPSRRDLLPLIGKITGSTLRLTGRLKVDGCIFLAQTDMVETFTQQTDIRSGPRAQQFLAANQAVSARGCLVLGCPVTHTRARREVQEDDTDEGRVFVGEFYCAVHSGEVDVSGSRFERLARGPFVASDAPNLPIRYLCDDTYYDLIWSDHMYIHKGHFQQPSGNRRFHGRVTAKPISFWQSRKPIEVDLRDGRGWRDFPASGLTQDQLPCGRRAAYAGTYDFERQQFTPGHDPKRSMMVRLWYRQGRAVADRPGYQWHASQVEYPLYDRNAQAGTVWMIETPQMRIRLYVDAGHYDEKTGAWVPGQDGTPAQSATGTHCDNFQVNTASLAWDGFTASDVFMFNDAQGPYMLGTTRASMGAMDMRNHIVVTSVYNATLLGAGNSTLPSNIRISDWLVAQRQTRFRLPTGGAPTTRFYFGGKTTDAVLDNVSVATANSVDVQEQLANVQGKTRHMGAPMVKNYDKVFPPALGPSIADLVDPKFLDPVFGNIRQDVVPRDLRFSKAGEAFTGMALNDIVERTIGDHPRWDDTLREIVGVYFKAPDVTLEVAANTPVGTALDLGGKIAATHFHATHGAARDGYFGLDGKGHLVVLRPLTGIDAVRLLRTDRDETILVDIK